jgi:hypothetical protein
MSDIKLIKMSGNEQREMMIPSALFFELAQRETRWKCEMCGLYFKSSENLSNHLGSFDRPVQSPSDNPYNKPTYTHCVCKYCGSKFESSHSLQLHIGRKHNKIKSVFCSICFKWFLHKYALTSHMNYTHLKTKIATCKYCKSEFYNKHIMMKHVKKCKARFPAPKDKSTEAVED